MDGLELAREIRKRPQFRGTFLVGISGYTQEDLQRRCFQAGCDHFFIKPVDPEDLHRLLESCRTEEDAGAAPRGRPDERAERRREMTETQTGRDDVMEMSLLLSAQQMAQLERAAQRRGLTVGNFFRQLIDKFLAREALARSAENETAWSRPR